MSKSSYKLKDFLPKLKDFLPKLKNPANPFVGVVKKSVKKKPDLEISSEMVRMQFKASH